MDEAKVLKLLPDIEGKDLMTGNIISYDSKPYKVGCVTDSLLFLEPIGGASKDNPQIKCYVYQAKSMPVDTGIYEQLPIPVNDVPSWISCIHELQNWYYWSNGKKRLDLIIK